MPSESVMTGARAHGRDWLVPGLSLALVCAGLACAGIWNNTMGYSTTLFSPAGAPPLKTSDAYLVGRLIIALILIPLARKVFDHLRWVCVVSAITMCATTCLAVLSPLQSALSPQLLASVSVALGSMCYTVLTTSFYVLLARYASDRCAAGAIAVSLVLETVLSALVDTSGSEHLQALLVIVAPLITCLAFMGASQAFASCPSTGRCKALGQPLGSEPHAHASHPAPASPVSRAEQGLMLGRLCAYTIALVFIRALSSVGIWGRDRMGFIGMDEPSVLEPCLIGLLVMLLALVVYILPRRISTTTRSLIGFAVVLGGMQLLAFSEGTTFGALFDLITVSCELFAHLLMWMTYIECVRKTSMPAFRITGVRSIVYVVTTCALSSLLDTLFAPTGMLIMALNYALFLFVLFSLIRERGVGLQGSADEATQGAPGSTGMGALSNAPSGSDAAADMASFAQRHQLSEREAQIATLLLANTKRAEIERVTGLSEGTVRTHISRMYRKLDVHSRGELQELFEQERGSGQDAGGGAEP